MPCYSSLKHQPVMKMCDLSWRGQERVAYSSSTFKDPDISLDGVRLLEFYELELKAQAII